MKTKAKIVQIGAVDENGMPNNWTFDCSGTDTASVEISFETGAMTFGGYTIEELRTLAEAEMVN